MTTVGSLFSGIGGFDLGFERAGMRVLWQVEIDRAAQSVLRRHFPDTEIHDDVRSVGKHSLAPVDLICGGFPCQDLSVAGKRAGLAGERSGLWFEYHRILAELKPRWVVIENVPGLLSSNGGRDFAAVLRGLVELRYGVCWRVLDAQFFGVAQRRRRVFLVASLGSGSAAEVLFERESGARDTAPGREAGQGFAAVAGTFSANRGGTERPAGNANELDSCVPVIVATFDPRNVTSKANRTRVEAGLPANTLHQEGLSVISYNAYQRTVGDAHSPLTSEEKGRSEAGAITPFGVRRLMPVECERLQGFPDGWTERGADGPQSDNQRYRQLGNAVCASVAEWIGRRIEVLP